MGLRVKLTLMVRQHCYDALGITGGDKSGLTKATTALGVLFGENMTLESLSSLDLASTSELEALSGTAVGFLLRHDSNL